MQGLGKKVLKRLIVWALLPMLVVGYSVVVRAQDSAIEQCTLSFSHGLVLKEVPVARTQAEQATGLSNRHDIGSGMLFAWLKAEPRTFWMKDTYVPLSIGFFDASGILFSVQDMTPHSLKPHPSVLPALYALELHQGDFQRLGIALGTQLSVNCSLS